MRIIEFITSLDMANGGPSRSLPTLCIGLKRIGVECEVLTFDSPDPNIEDLNKHKVETTLIKKECSVLKKLQCSNLFQEEDFKDSIVHLHSIWEYELHTVISYLRKHNIRYIVSPRGMLEPWALNHKRLKKQLAILLYQRSDLSAAFCIHTTAESEAQHIRDLGFKNPIAVIPNGINTENYPLKAPTENRGKKRLSFLSRVHPIKGLEMLLSAWERLPKDLTEGWKITIAGDGSSEYPLDKFKEMVQTKYPNFDIEIVGPKYGKDKIDYLHNADIFILPTHSENFGMVIAEAMACGVPVITTTGAPWEILQSENLGWWVEPSIEGLTLALQEALVTPDNILREKGVKSRQIILENYSIEAVAIKYKQLYNWCMGKDFDAPAFIHQ